MKRSSSIDIQIVAMSATISNLSFLCSWMDAAEYVTDFRPVILSETLFTGGAFYDRHHNRVRTLDKDYVLPNDPDNVIGLCLETVIDGYGVLVFCATKNWCEKLSETIASAFSKITQKHEGVHLSEKLQAALSQLNGSNYLTEYKRIVGMVDPLLARTIPYGVAFHHAGLTMEERDQLERAFRSGIIRVLVATSTLSSGVNLPARRVIIRSPWGRTGANSGPSLTHSAYKQMIGRAGRQGIDVEGESVIVCKQQEVRRAMELMNGSLERVESALVRREQSQSGSTGTSGRFKRAVLEAVVGNFATSISDVVTYANCTLMAAEVNDVGDNGTKAIPNYINDSVNYLLAQQFIVLEDAKLTATQLGRATLASAMNPDEAWMMYQDLKQALRSLVLESELHMVYLVTPTYMQDQWGPDFDWYRYHDIWCRLTDEKKHVAEVVGVSEAFIVLSSRRHGAPRPQKSSAIEERRYAIHMRFYTALALHDLIEERPISQVAQMFGCNRGFLQALQLQASTYAGMAVAFCDRLGWYYMKNILSGFAERIAFGVRRELTELVQIDGIDGSRARCFHHSGFTTLASVVYAKPNEIAAVLRKAVPFKSESDGSRTLRRCWLAAHPEMGEEDAVALIQRKAKSILEENLSRFGILLDNTINLTSLLKRHPSDPSTNYTANQEEAGRGVQKETGGGVPEEIGTEGCTERNISGPATLLKAGSNEQNVSMEMKSIRAVEMESGKDPDSASPTPTSILSSSSDLELDTSYRKGDVKGSTNITLDKIVSTDPVKQSTPKEAAGMDANSAGEDLDVVLMNMSKISITPRSDASRSSSKMNSTKRSDLDLTESQIRKIFTDGGSQLVFSPSTSSSPVTFHENGKSTQTTMLSGMEMEMNGNGPSQKECRPSPGMTPVSRGKNENEQDSQFWIDLPPSLSEIDVAKIRKSNDDSMIDSGDVDLFDEDTRTRSSDVSCSSLEEEIGLSPVAIGTAIPDDMKEIKIVKEIIGQKVIEVINHSVFQTPVLQARKRPRALRCTSEHSTPSPLARKCIRGLEEQPRVNVKVPAEVKLTSMEIIPQVLPTDEGTQGEGGKLRIINCCSTFKEFSTFASCWRNQELFAMDIVTKKLEQGFQNGHYKEVTNRKIMADCESKYGDLVGIAVSWSYGTVYYLPLVDEGCTDHSADQTIHSSSSDNVTLKERLRLLRRCLCVPLASNSTKIIFDFLHVHRQLIGLIGPLVGTVHCLRIADWLLSCGRSDSPPVNSIESLIARYSKQRPDGVLGDQWAWRTASMYGLWAIMEERLKSAGLWTSYIELEMPSVTVIGEMESNGVCFDFHTWTKVTNAVKELSEELERRAHLLAGRPFSLSSYSDLSKVLYVELNLPADGGGATTLQVRRCRAQSSRRHYSTSKEILQKLCSLHPLPGVVLDWRKLHGALISTILPLQKRSYSSGGQSGMKRIFGTYDWFTATGRVIMHEPSLQTVPRPFEVTNEDGSKAQVNVRELIIAEPGSVLLSADYSQLELRILAHLSNDEKLLGILNSDEGDVFRIIASAWLGVPHEQVDSEQRQRAKKLCYGVIYGMGARSLAEELDVSEETAVGFMDAFKHQFPGVFGWMADVIEKTRRDGYVTTLSGRRRYLPAIANNGIVDQRLQAERQAINTSVQGSAADVFKAALRDVHSSLRKVVSSETAYRFVLQLHDELIIETKGDLIHEVAEIVRRGMEQCYQLRARLRVRLSVGKSCGDLHPM